MGLFKSLFVFTDINRTLCGLINHYATFSVLMDIRRFLRALMGPFWSMWVLISLFTCSLLGTSS